MQSCEYYVIEGTPSMAFHDDSAKVESELTNSIIDIGKSRSIIKNIPKFVEFKLIEIEKP